MLERLPDKTFARRLNSISIPNVAIANDAMYRNICWVDVNGKTKHKTKLKTLSDIELIYYIETNILQLEIIRYGHG